TAAGRIYAFRGDGAVMPGFPITTPVKRNVATHLGAPVFTSGAITPPSATTTSRPAIADLDHDGYPEIVYANIEGDVYGFHQDGTPEIVISTNEVYDATGDESQFFPSEQGGPTSIPGLNTGTVLAGVFAQAGGSGRIYALHADGNLHAGGPFVAGWPVKLDGL